jgi:hypothetical protein
MNAHTITGDIVETEAFFAPVSSDMIDGLIGQYQHEKKNIQAVAEFMGGEGAGSSLHYFIEGNKADSDRFYGFERMFQIEGAIACLNATYWQKALNLTDVIDCMPQKRRDEWFEQIRNPLGTKRDKYSKDYIIQPLPEFSDETVRATIGELLLSRQKFFSERVDGIFRSLSGTHVTNEPQGFGKRMIIAGVLCSYGMVNHSKAGYINDLRAVIAKFMGRDQPSYGSSDDMIRAASRNPGQWMPIDAGAMRIRVYNGVGTAHLEVHPDMAWRLNCILASLYPAAIPPKFRQKPTKTPKDFVMMGRLLPFAVVSALAQMETAIEPIPGDIRGRMQKIENSRRFRYDIDKAVRDEVDRVLQSIGGVKMSINAYSYFNFDYDPSSVIDEIVCSGCVPDHKSHQFYPTPQSLASMAVDLADIQHGHQCLEPSAGMGGLADFMPKDKTQCIEISELHCKVLEAKGYKHVYCGDFLTTGCTVSNFHRIVMNPPFSEGRWQAHLKHAATKLAHDGKLVAILPASAKGKDDLLPSNFACEWTKIYDNEFAGTSVSVVILVANKV